MRINWFCAIFGPHYSLCHENGFIWTHFSSCSHFHHERRDYSLEGKTRSQCCSSDVCPRPPKRVERKPPSEEFPVVSPEVTMENKAKLWSLLSYLHCSHLWGRDSSQWVLQGFQGQLTGDPEGRVYQGEHQLHKAGEAQGSYDKSSYWSNVLKPFIPTAPFLRGEVRRHHTNTFQTSDSPNPVTIPKYIFFPLVEKYSNLNEFKLDERIQAMFFIYFFPGHVL